MPPPFCSRSAAIFELLIFPLQVTEKPSFNSWNAVVAQALVETTLPFTENSRRVGSNSEHETARITLSALTN
jgi:hypothetical protein